MKEQTLSRWEWGSGGQSPQLGDEKTDFEGMGAGVWGLNPQFGDESPPVRLVRLGRFCYRWDKCLILL